MLRTLLCRVEVRSDRINITLSRCRLTELLAGSLDLKMQHHGSPMRLPWLAPDITTAIINGRKPPQLTPRH